MSAIKGEVKGSMKLPHEIDFEKPVYPPLELVPPKPVGRRIFGNHDRFRKEFPIIRRVIDGRQLVLTDNATTGQVPRPVIDAVDEYLAYHVENVHRSTGGLPGEADRIFTRACMSAAAFVNASYNEIFWCHNTTEGLNAAVQMVAKHFTRTGRLKKGDRLLTTSGEHNSTVVPLQMLREDNPQLELDLQYVDIVREGSRQGRLDVEDLEAKLTPNTKIVTMTMTSNVTGVVNPIKKISGLIKERCPDAVFIVDCAQSGPHMPIDVKDLGCDIAVIAGHKLAQPAESFVYMREDLAREVSPHMGGGGIVQTVGKEGRILLDAPYKFHLGTPQVPNARALDVATRFLTFSGLVFFERDLPGLRRFIGGCGIQELERLSNLNERAFAYGLRGYFLEDERQMDFRLVNRAMGNILQHEREMTEYFMERLGDELGGRIEVIGPKPARRGDRSYLEDRVGVVSIRSKDVPVGELADGLDKHGVVVRAGCHCWHVGMRELGLLSSDVTGPNDGTVRFSMTHFSNMRDVDRAIEALREIHAAKAGGK